ncbi:hypothetical protein [Megasphaera vaginalis (ex Srinivasan et al. 2021)]|uniref:Uncharacterized protein n=1 Tax=Megasphaera vaginalis (ex Srinivasan et al. 2021) TaxID=1111454 RepID=U7UCM7_9FIRM|nr:hypothetical protein [Megasphaera vaginalis (ex Srinivasan et al. 2021)]ERT57125.1 hypothetical protein HMPREF1250_1629 [Megasphaera vaginalis (ex Srinivasan et al. 2021)]
MKRLAIVAAVGTALTMYVTHTGKVAEAMAKLKKLTRLSIYDKPPKESTDKPLYF